mmetsp:Transcript_42047/g.121480  ORF Transcript_42047/g.121480 Transcript_42047/m.121480 type:complete len:368 (-) Transcript_42047:196-1299(-)
MSGEDAGVAAAPPVAPAAPASGSAPAVAGGNEAASVERLTAEVNKCKAVLETKDAPAFELIVALKTLTTMGTLPTKVLGDTLIGKTVNSIAKAAADEGVRTKAKELVEQWRQMHRKRKSSDNLGGQPALKRGLSSRPSFDSEAPGGAPSQDSLTGTQASEPGASQASLPRQDSLFSLAEDSVDQPSQGGALPAHREKVRQKLLEALGKAEEIEAKDGSRKAEEGMRDPVALASEIDEALNAVFPKKEEYLAQARSILYNLKDKKNHTFRFKVMVGFYKPMEIPKLTAEDMASDEKNAERAKLRKYSMEEIQSDWALKNGQQRITGMFTCGKCKGMKTTYFQMQTRSSDEPMTTFVTCLQCNNRWKFC